MSKQFAKLEKAVSPKGVAVFPWLQKPDTKWKAEGEYKTGLRLSGDEAEAFKAAVDARVQAALTDYQEKAVEEAGVDPKRIAVAKRTASEMKTAFPYKYALDESGNETDEIEFSFKTKASYKDRKTGATVNKRVTVVDAKRNPVTEDIFGGSVLKIAFEYLPYYSPATKTVGVSLRISAVQVLELVNGSSGVGAAAFAFDEEDGFVSSGKQKQEEKVGVTADGFEEDDSEGDF